MNMSEDNVVNLNTKREEANSERQKYNTRIAAKRKKGHRLQMIVDYAVQCPVPLDQLDLTPEERAEVERRRRTVIDNEMRYIQYQRTNIAKHVLECGVPIDQLELLPGELADIKRIQDEQARRKEQWKGARQPSLEAIAAKVKASVESTVQLEPSVFDNLAKSGVLGGSLSFKPRGGYRKWEGEVLTEDYRLWTYSERSSWRPDEQYEYKQPAPEPPSMWEFEHAVDEGLAVKFPNSKATLMGTIYFHVPTRAAVLDDDKQLPDVSTLPRLFDTLAQHGVATVELSFQIESWNHWEETHRNLNVRLREMLNANGEAVNLSDDDLDKAVTAAVEEHGERTIWDCEDDYFTGGEGTVTFDILQRKVSLKGDVSTGDEDDGDADWDEVDETWDVDKTETAAA
jgi:hypothetical protein